MERTEVLTVRVSKREKALFEKAAKDSGLTVSDYMRSGAMICAMIDGQTEAVKITAELVKEKLGGQLEVARRAVGATA